MSIINKMVWSFFLFFSANGYCQQSIPVATNLKDTIAKSIDLADKPNSYFKVSAAVSNALFSTKNKSLSVKETSSILVLSPTVGYFNKLGYFISAGVDFLNNPTSGFGVNQYLLNIGYELPENKKYSFSINYTNHFVKEKYSAYASPIQHDLFSNFVYKKTILQPGVSVGYSSGKYYQSFFKDTVINNRNKHFYDSATSKISTFSISPSVGHIFEIKHMFSRDDNFLITPTAMLNFGYGKSAIIKNITNRPNFIHSLIKKGIISKLDKSTFGAESIAFNLEMNYSIGNFSILPQAYLDYYLANTDTNRFSKLFSIAIEYSF